MHKLYIIKTLGKMMLGGGLTTNWIILYDNITEPLTSH